MYCGYSIIRGTTPIISFEVPADVDMTLITEIWISLAQNGKIIVDRVFTHDEVQVLDNVISIKLEQEDTLALKTYATAIFAVRMKTDGGVAMGSYPLELEVIDTVKGGVI
jgi:hypothetical protein